MSSGLHDAPLPPHFYFDLRSTDRCYIRDQKPEIAFVAYSHSEFIRSCSNFILTGVLTIGLMSRGDYAFPHKPCARPLIALMPRVGTAEGCRQLWVGTQQVAPLGLPLAPGTQVIFVLPLTVLGGKHSFPPCVGWKLERCHPVNPRTQAPLIHESPLQTIPTPALGSSYHYSTHFKNKITSKALVAASKVTQLISWPLLFQSITWGPGAHDGATL